MNEPVRLREAGCEEARLLLGAGKLDVPGTSRQRALAFTSVAASLATTGTAAAAGATSLIKGVALYVCLGAVGGGAASFVLSEVVSRAAKPPSESTSAPTPKAASTLAPHRVPLPETSNAPQPAPAAVASTALPAQHVSTPEPRGNNTTAEAQGVAVTAPTSSASAGASRPATSLLDEQRIIEAARSAMGRGDATRALTLLDGYERAYGQGQFGPEALALRVESLRLRSDVAQARALALEFQRRYPHHPLLVRVQASKP